MRASPRWRTAIGAIGVALLSCRIPVGVCEGQEGGAAVAPRAVRDAIGGNRLGQVRNIVLEGVAQHLFEDLGGDVLQARREVRVAFPADYLQVDHFGATEVTTGIGLRNNTLVRVSGPSTSLAPKEVQEAFRRNTEQKMRRHTTLVLAAFLLASDTPVPIRYEYAGRAQSPDGTAEAIDITWAEGLAARLFVDRDTKLPVMLTFEELEIRRRPKPTSPAEFTFPMPEYDKVPQAWYFSDYRRVDGIMIPHTWIHTVAGATKMQFTVTRARVNVPRVLDAFPK